MDVLVTQSSLKVLAQGGWKLTAADFGDFQGLITQLAGNSSEAKEVLSQLSPATQSVVKNGDSMIGLQREELMKDLNNLIQTNQPIYNPTGSEVRLAAETQSLWRLYQAQKTAGQKPQRQLLQHLNVLLLHDALQSLKLTAKN